jgi:DNA-binding LacI/PurR family transcriptional regulator
MVAFARRRVSNRRGGATVSPARAPRARAARPTPAPRARLPTSRRAAGVSTMTVVRVLRDPGKVADATRERASSRRARAIGYTPRPRRARLASRRSGLVAAVDPVLTNSLIAEIMQGLTDALAPAALHLLIGASGFSAAEEECSCARSCRGASTRST